ncbi:MAG: peptidylprolyl isomerase [Planctomycetes bacterium]|nr:peptidylprolyl isomerase [Planctomycetota bacterium]
MASVGCRGQRHKGDTESGGHPGSPGRSTSGDSSKPTLRPTVRMRTNMGDIMLELDAENAPNNTLNFLDYAKDGFYNGTVFHRVVKGRLIQGGGYTASFDAKKEGLRPGVRNESVVGLTNSRGTIAMFRKPNEPNSGQSQFFINVADNAELDRIRDGYGYSVFGRVVGGMDVVDKIQNVPVGVNPKYAAGRNPVVPEKLVIVQSVELKTPFDRDKAVVLAENFRNEYQRKLEARTAELEQKSGNKAVILDSGLRYVDFVMGKGASPVPTDTVEIYYRGTLLLDGTEFDTSEKDGQRTKKMAMSSMLPGLQQAMSTMCEHGRRTIIVPSNLAFGAYGQPGKVPPYATLMFDIELNEVSREPIEPPKLERVPEP